MSYPQPLLRLSWGGTIDVTDQWSNNVHLQPRVAGNTEGYLNDANISKFADAIKACYITGTNLSLAPWATLDWVKLAAIGPDGKYLADPVEYEFNPSLAGYNAGTGNKGYSDTLAVTLATGVKRGRAKVGRIYPPGFSAGVLSDGKVNPADIETYLANFVKMFRTFNNISDTTGGDAGTGQGNFQVVIASRIGSGAVNPVTIIQVGNVFDVQVRRRNRLKEVYHTTTIPS